MRKTPDRPSAKDLLASLAEQDKSESKHKELFFIPPTKVQRLPIPEPNERLTAPVGDPPLQLKPSTPVQPLAVAPPTDEELGISWVDRLKKLLETRSVVLVIDDGADKKLIPMDDAAFTLAAKALQTRPIK